MVRAVVCLAGNVKHAERVIDELRNAGFSSADVSALLPRRGHAERQDERPRSDLPELASGALAWLQGAASLAIPGLGPFTATGPMMEALTRASLAPGDDDAVVGAMTGMGIPELDAKRYEAKLREGSILISIHTANIEERTVARRIFERAGGDCISYTTEEIL